MSPGVTAQTQGANDNWFAAYANWYFKVYGHGDVRLLDVGRKRWELEERELVSEAPTRPFTSYGRSRDIHRRDRAAAPVTSVSLKGGRDGAPMKPARGCRCGLFQIPAR